MADIKLNFSWSIIENGDIEINVHPSTAGHISIGSLTLDEDLFLTDMEDDLTEYRQGASESVLYDWEELAFTFAEWAEKITNKLEEAREYRRPRKPSASSFKV